MGPTRVNRKLSFESGEEQIKGYGKVIQNTEIFSRKYGNDILEVGSPEPGYGGLMDSAQFINRLVAKTTRSGIDVRIHGMQMQQNM